MSVTFKRSVSFVVGSIPIVGAAAGAVLWAGANVAQAGPLLTDANGSLTIGLGPAIVTSPAAATFQHGAADAAAPVAQTVKAQGVVAGTLNTATPNLTFQTGASSGSAGGGGFVFQMTPAGISGSSQNPYTTVLTLGASAAFSGPISSIDGRFIASSNSVMNLATNGSVKFSNNANTNSFTLSCPGATATPQVQLGNLDAAAPVAQIVSMQNVVAGTSNTAGVNLTINGSISTGTGVPGDIILQTAGKGASATVQNSLMTALTIKGGTTNGTNVGQPSIVMGSAAIATNSTDGFLYLASGAGTPTGTPTTFTGRVPMYIDTTNSQLWLYLGGAWKQPKTPAAAATITWQ